MSDQEPGDRQITAKNRAHCLLETGLFVPAAEQISPFSLGLKRNARNGVK